MKGVVLANVDVVKMMDNSLAAGATSDIIPVGFNKDGSYSKQSKVLNEEEFEEMQAKVQEIIKDISKEILDGKIDIKPYSYKQNTGCKFCEYKAICRFNPNQKDNSYNYIK